MKKHENVGMGADKRTEEQRRNDVAQEVRPLSAEDDTYVTTGPATGKVDERVTVTENE